MGLEFVLTPLGSGFVPSGPGIATQGEWLAHGK